jgi:hypothetical protein
LALNQEGHLTRQQLLDVTVEMLDEVSHEDLTMAIVLEKANVSKSSPPALNSKTRSTDYCTSSIQYGTLVN